MRSLIIEVAVAGLPEPMPVVVNVVGVEVVDRRGTSPEVPIQVAGRRAGGLLADGSARFAAIAVGDLQTAVLPSLDVFLKPGLYDFHFVAKGNVTFDLEWEGPGFERRRLDDRELFHLPSLLAQFQEEFNTQKKLR